VPLPEGDFILWGTRLGTCRGWGYGTNHPIFDSPATLSEEPTMGHKSSDFYIQYKTRLGVSKELEVHHHRRLEGT
jgi:hypothetical protein